MNIKIVSVDEKTGIHVLERIAPDKCALPGNPEKRKVEYERHGTFCLIPNFDVTPGHIIEYFIGGTRGFVEHTKKTIDSDLEWNWILSANSTRIN